jgi:hypothetical protein
MLRDQRPNPYQHRNNRPHPQFHRGYRPYPQNHRDYRPNPQDRRDYRPYPQHHRDLHQNPPSMKEYNAKPPEQAPGNSEGPAQLSPGAFQARGKYPETAAGTSQTADELRLQLADMQEQLNRLTGYDGLPNGGPARMYSTTAIVNRVQQHDCGLTELWLDGGSTHHVVRHPSLPYNRTASQVNSVLVAGGEDHQVQCEGDMMIECPSGDKIFKGVLCVPTFVVNLLSTPQLDLQGKGVSHKHSTACIFDEDGKMLSGRLEGSLYKLHCQIKQHLPDNSSSAFRVHESNQATPSPAASTTTTSCHRPWSFVVFQSLSGVGRDLSRSFGYLPPAEDVFGWEMIERPRKSDAGGRRVGPQG